MRKMRLVERYPAVEAERNNFNSAEAENEVGGMLSCRGSGTEQTQKLRFGGSVTKAENEGGINVLWWTRNGKNRNSAEAWRNGSLRWIRNMIKIEVRWKRGGTLSYPVTFHLKAK